ncbi:hypothetical protein JWG42_18630, partial [Desulfoprunum benzoelyticum]|uniref:hypothetical protein n=1 Tax=Desulfoprunum benzoelyticum TaxID=1506996 RepID=UPI001966244D
VLRRTRLASWVTVEEILADAFWESLKRSWARVQVGAKKMGAAYFDSVLVICQTSPWPLVISI